MYEKAEFYICCISALDHTTEHCKYFYFLRSFKEKKKKNVQRERNNLLVDIILTRKAQNF